MLTTRLPLTSFTITRITGDDPAAVPAIGVAYPATVPGCVHTDLLRAGLIDDPYLGDNEIRLGWIGRCGWRYTARFNHPDHSRTERVSLDFDGIDTIATITVNGTRIDTVRDMHRRHRYDITDLLIAQGNELIVDFEPQATAAESLRAQMGSLPNAYPNPFNFVRKMACNFGWDWGPQLVTAGLWRPVTLSTWSTARLADVAVLADVDAAGNGVVEVRAAVDRPNAGSGSGEPDVQLEVDVDGVQGAVSTITDGQLIVHLTVPTPKLWWPRGMGEQPLSLLRARLVRIADGHVLDSFERQIGFRHVELDTSLDAIGHKFVLSVNGREVFVRGANWIPDDCFPHRVDDARYRRRVNDAVEANLNLLRIWGGGIYEDDAFYDACDAAGIMVWQDFLFACAAYPEDATTMAEVEAEARDNVRRLSPHPSLVLWNGNNENIEGFADWGWQEQLDGRPWGRGYYETLLPKVVADEDPSRPYFPGSPFSGAWDVPPNDPDHGTKHIWDVWNNLDYPHYRQHIPRFAAEYGFQAPATWTTLHRALGDEHLRTDSAVFATHQKAIDGADKLNRSLAARFRTDLSFDDWHYLTQVNQARAFRLGIEHFRSHRGRCMGSIVWQLNDCWPVVSWSVVDGDGRRKPSWYSMRDAYEPRLVTIQPTDNGLTVHCVNDSLDPWSGELVIWARNFDGTVRAEQRTTITVPASAVQSVEVAAEIANPSNACAEVVTATIGSQRSVWFHAEDNELAYRPAELNVRIVQHDGAPALEICADTLVRDLTLLIDRVDSAASVNRQLDLLFPGEVVTLNLHNIEPGRLERLDRLQAPEALRCINDVLAGPTTVRLNGPGTVPVPT